MEMATKTKKQTTRAADKTTRTTVVPSFDTKKRSTVKAGSLTIAAGPAADPDAKPARQASGKMVYLFGGGTADGDSTMNDLLGGKGAGLAEMAKAGMPVPPGFTITTEACTLFYDNNMRAPKALDAEIKEAMAKVEELMGAKFGSTKSPLLVSVRSGAKFSMPGMMDTILNLGLNDQTAEALTAKTGNARFVLDSYRRFIQMFGNVVLGIEKEEFESRLEKRKTRSRVQQDTSLTATDLKEILKDFKAIVKKKSGDNFPSDPWKQLSLARDAVFKSWNNPRAITYRRMNSIPSDLGTAVNIQAMVFGNTGNKSGTGVGFTRNPATGEKEFYGEYLINAQGEDVVAGIRTPRPIAHLKKEMPQVYKELVEITDRLEKYRRDVQDFEFTVQDGTLYMLQTRNGKRTAQAAVKIAVDMVHEKLITKEEALKRIQPAQLNQLLHERIDPSAKPKVIATGLAASPGAASGRVVFTADDAVMLANAGEKVILVRQETNPDDIHGMEVAVGILTARGGMTSHAAVVARGMGKCCIVGAEKIKVNDARKQFTIDGIVVKEREIISLDGFAGQVFEGAVATIPPKMSNEFEEFMKWADGFRRLRVRANADTPVDARQAVEFGAEGIGLCRTEHMFFAKERLPIVQQLIMADNIIERENALQKLFKYQREDFRGIFTAMKGLPVTIRTLDPPLHEFLPKRHEIESELVALKSKSADPELIEAREKVLARIEQLSEFNPMLGHRGCRLGITFPEITQMQVRAIITAACDVQKEEKRGTVLPEIMIPLVGHVKEFLHQKEIVIKLADEIIRKRKVDLEYSVGTMIEVPRAALTADRIAAEADFFSFGTNDLTQMGAGMSRDDATKFLEHYVELGIYKKDPFVSIDEDGIGQLMKIGVEKGRGVKEKLKIGICGEHGGDPESIAFCNRLGLDYVSCSPYRVPVARLAAAQSVLGAEEERSK
jgi:pyruvate,orthophosphate dikinase